MASSERNSSNNEPSPRASLLLKVLTVVNNFWQVLVLLSTTIGFKTRPLAKTISKRPYDNFIGVFCLLTARKALRGRDKAAKAFTTYSEIKGIQKAHSWCGIGMER